MEKRLIRQPLILLLAFLLIFNPSFAGYALSEESEPADLIVEETSTEPNNEAIATDTESTTVTNENEANVENNTNVEANTGENEISPESSLSGEGVEGGNGENGEGGEGEGLTSTSEPEPEEEGGESEEGLTGEGGEDLGDGGEAGEAGATAVNQETPSDSESTASATLLEATEVTNENEANVENNISSTAQTGENQTSGNDCQINTGEAEAQTDAANVVNTNIVGEDFWQVIVNQFEDSQENLDLSTIEGIENLDADFLSLLAANLNTGSDSTNLALAMVLSLYAIYNDNTATLINNLDVLASTGSNQAECCDSSIQTGDAEAILNLFNMVNTNLIGSDWFFGVINLFGELEGDIILPNEWLFLGEEGTGGDSSVTAANVNSGEGSTNQAIAGNNNELNICNDNEAYLTNNISVLANSGNNEIKGTGEIDTGDANANLNLFNIVNTNIVGSRWVLLVINNFGEWAGNVLGWWGNALTMGNTTLLWVQLPLLGDGNSVDITALNSQTGEGSNNLALAQSQNLTTVENHNLATVENNVSVIADTGNNQTEGTSANIQTGNANASANIFNFLNTNIFGNNWYFCMINIFDSFIGNILFHREPEPSPEPAGSGTGQAAAAGGPPGPPVCHDQTPGGAPRLLSAVAGENSVTLTWEKAPDPVSYYLIAYGESSGIYVYGNPNVGGPDATSYTVGNLSGGTTYYFVVRAGNGCTPGPFSNEMAATPYGSALEGAASGFYPGVLGVQAAEGELGEALSDEGEVAGAQSSPFRWWFLLPFLAAGLLGVAFRGLYLFLKKG